MLRARVLTQAQLERALRRQAVRIAEQVSQQTYSSRHDCETIRPCRWEIGAQIDLFGAGQTAPWQTATRTHNGGYRALRTGRAVTVCNEIPSRAGTPGAPRAGPGPAESRHPEPYNVIVHNTPRLWSAS